MFGRGVGAFAGVGRAVGDEVAVAVGIDVEVGVEVGGIGVGVWEWVAVGIGVGVLVDVDATTISRTISGVAAPLQAVKKIVAKSTII